MTVADSPPLVVVPSRTGSQFLEHLLESLQKQTVTHDVVVVENPLGTVSSPVKSALDDVKRIRPGKPLGFGASVNLGVREGAGDPLVVLNDDVVCAPHFLERLVAALDPSNGVCMAACVLLQASRPDVIDSAGVMFDRTLLAWDYLHGSSVEAVDATTPPPLGPTGAAAVFARAAYEEVGGFDEAMFAYLEDVDLVARLLAAGGRCRLAPGARALHHGSATFGSRSSRKRELMGWSRGYLLAKYGVLQSARLAPRAMTGELAIALGQAVADRSAVGIRARLRGFSAGRRTPRQPLPALPPEVAEQPLRHVLRLRAARRFSRP